MLQCMHDEYYNLLHHSKMPRRSTHSQSIGDLMARMGSVEDVDRRPTTVVRLRRINGVVVQDCDVYIGRKIFRGGWNLPQSKWHNPFPRTSNSLTAHRDATEAYDAYIRSSRPDLLASLEELRGKRLGCWCKNSESDDPDEQAIRCHGEVLVQLLNEKDAGLLNIP